MRRKEDIYLDKINKISDWGRIKEKLEKKYKWTKNTVCNRAYTPLILRWRN